MQLSVFWCVLLWTGAHLDRVLHQRRRSDHFTYFLLKAYDVTNTENSGVLSPVKIIKKRWIMSEEI